MAMTEDRDITNAINTARKEAKEEGMAEGMEKGMEKGLAEGMEKAASLSRDRVITGYNNSGLYITRATILTDNRSTKSFTL